MKALTIKECNAKIAELREHLAEIKDGPFASCYRQAYAGFIHYYQTEKDRLAQKIGKK